MNEKFLYFALPDDIGISPLATGLSFGTPCYILSGSHSDDSTLVVMVGFKSVKVSTGYRSDYLFINAWDYYDYFMPLVDQYGVEYFTNSIRDNIINDYGIISFNAPTNIQYRIGDFNDIVPPPYIPALPDETETESEIETETESESETDELESDESTEDSTEDSSDIDYSNIDFEPIISFLQSQDYARSEDIEFLIEEENRTIFDKELSEYTVTEGLLLIIGVVFVISLCVRSIERIFLKWK